MATLDKHHSDVTTKLLLIGDCLSWDTLVSVTRGNSRSKKKTLEQLYNSFHESHHNKDESLDTYLIADVDGVAGLHKMTNIIQSGVKEVFEVVAGDKVIKATAEHEFKTPTGFFRLKDLKVGDEVLTWRFSREVDESKSRENNGRAFVYSVQYHPFAFANVVGGKNYKRIPYAKAVIEAAMNGLTVDQFVDILRNSARRASLLDYLPYNAVVHHKDGDPSNDDISNLEVTNKTDHDAEHHPEVVKASKAIVAIQIESIESCGETMTYDISMDDPHRNFIANGFVVHNSGKGKTGALAPLVADGYKLFIEDYDDGLDYLKNRVQKDSPDKAKNVHYISLRDDYIWQGSNVAVSKAIAFSKGMSMLGRWIDPETNENLGSITTWGPDTIVVIDSLSFMAKAAMNQTLALNNRLSSGPEQRDWGLAQGSVENALAWLYSPAVKCNVIVIAHIDYIADANGVNQGYPKSLGKALSPQIPRYFNTMLLVKETGAGANKKKIIRTAPEGTVGVKHPIVDAIPLEMPIESGLSTFFKLARKGKPIPTVAKPSDDDKLPE